MWTATCTATRKRRSEPTAKPLRSSDAAASQCKLTSHAKAWSYTDSSGGFTKADVAGVCCACRCCPCTRAWLRRFGTWSGTTMMRAQDESQETLRRRHVSLAAWHLKRHMLSTFSAPFPAARHLPLSEIQTLALKCRPQIQKIWAMRRNWKRRCSDTAARMESRASCLTISSALLRATCDVRHVYHVCAARALNAR